MNSFYFGPFLCGTVNVLVINTTITTKWTHLLITVVVTFNGIHPYKFHIFLVIVIIFIFVTVGTFWERSYVFLKPLYLFGIQVTFTFYNVTIRVCP